MEQEHGRIVLHGGKQDRGWMAVISEKTGKSLATIPTRKRLLSSSELVRSCSNVGGKSERCNKNIELILMEVLLETHSKQFNHCWRPACLFAVVLLLAAWFHRTAE